MARIGIRLAPRPDRTALFTELTARSRLPAPVVAHACDGSGRARTGPRTAMLRSEGARMVGIGARPALVDVLTARSRLPVAAHARERLRATVDGAVRRDTSD
ncbi:hypothetical protein LXH13_14645 [Streptomyces spinosirectus]|jgi:hypothetical protein|uniref:hypothetical protein n=1 Tax=Streptomyces spinosirectus TaxID=2906474 RepID=UPI001F1BAE7E|nr:hypothetical protein [Streptomyces spinosirectus]UIR18202.1 hypothetical protein LXH13_14645 [Streptomyces spinosirectus]